jgi:hypothetical protein
MSKRMLSIVVGGLALMVAGGASAADATQGSLVVNKVTPEGAGVLIGFTIRPTDCSTSYKGAYAYLATSLKDFDALYALASVAEITGQPVTISYIDNGDCSSLGQLLSLSKISN